MKLSTVLAFCAIAATAVQARECPKLHPEPINEKWFLEKRKAGFHAQLAAGASKEDLHYEPKPIPEAKEPKYHKLCVRGHRLFKGKDLGLCPDMQCEYNDVSEQCCKPANPEAAKKVREEFGIHTPDYVKSTIVLTDNSTFVVLSFCIDGVKPCWTVLTTDGKAKLDHASIAEALEIPKEEVDKAEKEPKPFMPGATFVTEGECPKEEMLKIEDSVKKEILEYIKS